MKRLALLPVILLALSACASTTSQNVYSAYEVGVPKTVERCRVLAVRNITIQGDTGRELGQVIGTAAGAIAGGAAANEIGKGSGQAVATVLGGLAAGIVGGIIGNQIGSEIDQRPGLEYSIIDAGGREITFAQEIAPGDRMINAGETCRIQTDPYGNNRVLPIDGFPERIARPQTTNVY